MFILKTTPIKRIAVAFGMLVGVAIILLLVQRAGEPTYQGKRLSNWIAGLEYENLNPSDELRIALHAMGEPAVTKLIAILEKRDSPLKRKFVAYAKRNADIHNRFIAPRYVIPEDIYHAQAATALGEMGTAAQAAIPALMVASTNHDMIVAYRAKAALMKIRQEPIEPLLRSLENTGSTNWDYVALTLKYLGTNAQAAVPLLAKALLGPNARLHESAADALGGIVSHPEISVPALIECVRTESDAGVRRTAIDALLKFRTEKKQIVPLLLSFMQDRDLNVWLGAGFGLEDILSQDEKKTILVPALIQSLNNPDPTIRANAALFLKRNDPAAAAKAGVN